MNTVLLTPCPHSRYFQPVLEPSIPALLRERASLQPSETAYTFVDYEQDWAGVAESLTWSHLYQRVRNVARNLRLCASPGDRAVISAPQGLDYIVAFLGALEAGIIAVPLSVPLGGVADERVDSVLRDASPTTVLTTSSAVDDVTRHVTPRPGNRPHRSSKSICLTWTLRLIRYRTTRLSKHGVFAIYVRIDSEPGRSNGFLFQPSGQL